MLPNILTCFNKYKFETDIDTVNIANVDLEINYHVDVEINYQYTNIEGVGRIRP